MLHMDKYRQLAGLWSAGENGLLTLLGMLCIRNAVQGGISDIQTEGKEEEEEEEESDLQAVAWEVVDVAGKSCVGLWREGLLGRQQPHHRKVSNHLQSHI